jgi:hypothetical protein
MYLGFQDQQSRLWLGGYDPKQIIASKSGRPYGSEKDFDNNPKPPPSARQLEVQKIGGQEASLKQSNNPETLI